MNIIYTLQIQDGDSRYTVHSPQKHLPVDKAEDIKKQINFFGEQTAREFLAYGECEQNGEWYEVEGGCRAVRYYSYEVIHEDEVFDLIERILQK